LNVADPHAVSYVTGTKGTTPGTSLNGAMSLYVEAGFAYIACFEGSAFVVVSINSKYPTPA
jgi:hypothetical protein